MTPADRTRRILRKVLSVDAERLTDDASLVDDLGADSLDVVEIIMTAEEEFDIVIPDDEVEACTTVGDWIKLVEGRVGL